MKKSELIDAIAEKTGMTKTNAGSALDAAVSTITDAVSSGDTVAVPGLGVFSVSSRAARTGRNPKTGDAVEIPASNLPKFKAGKPFKDLCNQ